jgi:hypothetical protein
VKARYKTLRIDKLVTGAGRSLPPRLAQEIQREIRRLVDPPKKFAPYNPPGQSWGHSWGFWESPNRFCTAKSLSRHRASLSIAMQLPFSARLPWRTAGRFAHSVNVLPSLSVASGHNVGIQPIGFAISTCQGKKHP